MVAAGQVSKHGRFSVSPIFSDCDRSMCMSSAIGGLHHCALVVHVRCACQLPLAECTVRDVLMHLDGRAAPGHVSA